MQTASAMPVNEDREKDRKEAVSEMDGNGTGESVTGKEVPVPETRKNDLLFESELERSKVAENEFPSTKKARTQSADGEDL